MLVLVLFFAALQIANAQTPKLYRVGILLQETPPPAGTRPDVLRQTLRDFGYIDGKNLILDFRGAEGDAKRFPRLAAELVASKPDVIIAETTPGSLAAMQATSTIPIVIVNVSDPVASGLVMSLAHPGGNITGATDFGLDASAKLLDLIHAAAPNATRVGVLMSDNPIHAAELGEIQRVAKGVGLTIVPTTIRSEHEFGKAFDAMATKKSEAVIVLAGPPISTIAQTQKVVDLAAQQKLPTIFEGAGSDVELGALLSYGAKGSQSWTVVATYVAKILGGSRPSELPVQQPTRFVLKINLRTAAALGLTIPPSMIVRADEVIQ
jgi:putative ABC transport system substrate-binding protein